MFHQPSQPEPSADPCQGCEDQADCSVWGFRVCYACCGRYALESEARKALAVEDRKALASELFGPGKLLRLDRAGAA